MSPGGQAWRLEVAAGEAGRRLDSWLAERLDLPRGEVQAMIAEGLVRVDGATRAKSHRLEGGERVSGERRAVQEVTAEPARFRVVF
ncbi:MAG TPA: S4 domain-containing protein, partial [Actinomycetota bacterium]|nr:S4 domain-containing protein [Actinomycetota bacterium]